jgi:hypothetical protein
MTMITNSSSVPQEILQECNRGGRIAFFVSLDETFPGDDVECAIVGLLVALIHHRNFNPVFAFTPDIPGDIAPEQMTLIFKKHH